MISHAVAVVVVMTAVVQSLLSCPVASVVAQVLPCMLTQSYLIQQYNI